MQLKSWVDFFYMHGYGTSVFSAYGAVIIYLAGQWLYAWQRWRNYLIRTTTVQPEINISPKTTCDTLPQHEYSP